MGIYYAHAALCTHDTEKCLAFYRDLLGLHVAIDYGEQPSEIKTGDPDGKMHVMMLEDDKELQCLEVFEFFETEQREFEGDCLHTDFYVPHIAFTVDDLPTLYNKLVDAGVKVSIPLVDLGGYKFAYVFDFEGFLVEFVEASTY